MKKTLTLFLALLTTCAAGAQSLKVIGGSSDNYMLLSVSANGKYAAGINQSTNNSILWDINSGEVLETANQETVNCVNNEGVMVGYQGDYPVKILPDLTVVQLLTDTMGMANAISDDGSRLPVERWPDHHVARAHDGRGRNGSQRHFGQVYQR